ncbi:MAG: hypothetical protein J3K34DRAFT_427838 [Monoraphidium minutum]|nr:MAG: hypothetical protein J3K34DRAFT_427838 [Monoraphidium minutum]
MGGEGRRAVCEPVAVNGVISWYPALGFGHPGNANQLPPSAGPAPSAPGLQPAAAQSSDSARSHALSLSARICVNACGACGGISPKRRPRAQPNMERRRKGRSPHLILTTQKTLPVAWNSAGASAAQQGARMGRGVCAAPPPARARARCGQQTMPGGTQRHGNAVAGTCRTSLWERNVGQVWWRRGGGGMGPAPLRSRGMCSARRAQPLCARA